MRKTLKRFLVVALAVLTTVFCFSGCKPTDPPPEDFGPDLSALKTEGTRIVDEYGNPLLLQGINAGGYLVTEDWMCGVTGSVIDHKPSTEKYVELHGLENTLRIWEKYRSQYWTEQDFKNCADMGFNVIRLPFSYMTVDPQYHNVPAIEGEKYNFSVLDHFINYAKKYGMYTILDMHGAYGSQNGQNHSGQTISVPRPAPNQDPPLETVLEYVPFYSETDSAAIENRRKTTELWVAIADRYKNNPNIAGFDLLNEPGEKGRATQTRHFQYFDELYRAIREVNQNHIIIFEACWEGKDLPHPTKSTYNWDLNVMYSFHHYTHQVPAIRDLRPTSLQPAAHNDSMLDRLDTVEAFDFGVPLYMGEFTCLYGEESFEYTLRLFRERGWHWTTWTYRVNRRPEQTRSPWGIYNTSIPLESYLDPAVDSYETIMGKLDGLRTNGAGAAKYAFSSGRTLYDMYYDNCTELIIWD